MADLLAKVALFARDENAIDFPVGDNKTDTILGDNHFNLTVLEHYNYTLYENGTISNVSKCFLTFEPYAPVALIAKNGSFVNGTSCAIAVDPIGPRAATGIAFAALFGLTLVLILTCLAKHGKHHLPSEKRFYPIGRRWQWYWAIFVCACALVSNFMNIEVDRFRIQGLPMIVTVFFWYLMCMGITATTWEAVRHWGSWMERQYVDPNPFILSEDDRRSKVEFYLPLIFYFFLWMNFFLVVPRNWNFTTKQNSHEQTINALVPEATGSRFKAGAFMLLICWLLTVFSLLHSIRHYKPRHRGLFNRAFGVIQAMPYRFILIVPLTLSVVAYQALISFDFQYSVIKADGPVGIIYGWGYGAMLAILIIQVMYGYASPNEDKELIRQRRVRGDELDAEIGLVRRPAWWRRVKGEHLVGTFRDKLLRNVNEVGRVRGVGRREEGDMERDIRENMEGEALNDDDGYEMRNYGRTDNNPRVDRAGVNRLGRQQSHQSLGRDPESDRVLKVAAGLLFPDPEEADRRDREAEAERQRRLDFLQGEGPPPPSYYDNTRDGPPGTRRPAGSERSNSIGTLNSINAPPAQVRSMLDL